MNKKKNSAKEITTLILISLILIAFVFKSDLKRILKSDLAGCLDPLAINYNPNANIDDKTCEYVASLPNKLLLEIEDLKEQSWDKDKYLVLKDKIQIYFSSFNKSNLKEEKIALEKLDMAYIFALNKAAQSDMRNCFRSSRIIRNDVYEFYKKYKRVNQLIVNAQFIYNQRNQIFSVSEKVNELTSLEYSKENTLSLIEEIENFKKLSVFKSFEKCENLNKIIEESLSKLIDFRDIDINFKVWKMKIQFDFEIEKVSELDIYTFRQYKWYSDQVMAEDLRLRERAKKREEERIRRINEQKEKENLEIK